MSKPNLFEPRKARVHGSHLYRRVVGVIAPALLLAALSVTPAHAVDSSGFFELDANAQKETGGAADDWSSFYPSVPAGKRATGIIADTTPAVFRSGSKDTEDINTWHYELGSSPPKDDITHAYAAAYTAVGGTGDATSPGDLLIYFGADRHTFTGAASLGFWFFKQQVLRDDVSRRFVDANGAPARHSEGDTLVAFEYTNGGAVSSVKVYKWQGGRLVDAQVGSLTQIRPSVFCDASDFICGATNSGLITLAAGETVAAGQFFEGGINIGKLVGGDSCFASFMATSRSSDTINASIKNFVLGNFPVCHLTVTKTCDSAVYQANTSGDTVLISVKGAIVNDGGGALSNISLVDTPAFNTGSLKYFACDPGGNPTGDPMSGPPATLAQGGSVCYKAQHTSTTLSETDTVTATASTGAGTGSSTVTGTATTTCGTTNPGASLSITKVCDLDLVLLSSGLGVKVNFGGSVSNNGATTIKNVTVCEADIDSTTCNGLINVGDLAPGATKPYIGSYMPTLKLNIGDLVSQPETAEFKDQVTASGTLPAILGGGTVKSGIPNTATCYLCPR